MKINYAHKLDQFLKSKIEFLPLASEADLLAVGIASQKKFLSGIFFEEGISLASPVAGPFSNIFIGAYSYMNGDGYMRDKTCIGRFCSIGRRVSINAGMHTMSGVSSHPALQNSSGRSYSVDEMEYAGIRAKKNFPYVVIGHDVWIGDGAVIMPGVNIGTGSVIAANAVVVGNVPEYSIYAGVPARLIRRRFSPEVISNLLASQYWEHELSYLRTLSLSNVIEFSRELKGEKEVGAAGYQTYSIS